MFERVHEVGRQDHFPRVGVEFDIDVHLVTGGDPGAFADFRANADHELATHGGHAAAIGVAVDGDANRRPLARPEARHDSRWHPNASGGLATLQNGGVKPHNVSF
jgi:hypothetical protein